MSKNMKMFENHCPWDWLRHEFDHCPSAMMPKRLPAVVEMGHRVALSKNKECLSASPLKAPLFGSLAYSLSHQTYVSIAIFRSQLLCFLNKGKLEWKFTMGPNWYN